MISAVAARLFLALVLCASSNPSGVTGIVVDQHGRPLPRARVQITAAGRTAVVYTNSDGSFDVPVSSTGDCRVVASLTGFQDASAGCTAEPLALTLAVAPVEEHVVVTATRTETPTGQVASAVTVFTAADVQRRQEPPVADLLRDAPGTTVVRSGGLGSVTSLFVRGGESSYNKVLLDGIPLNEPGGEFDFGNLTSENLDRVEFVRGSNSALYGSDAMTSVIQLFTRRATAAQPQARVNLEGGTFSTWRGSASIAGRAGIADYSGAIARLSTDNAVPNDVFRNTTLSGTAGFRLAPGAVLRVVGRMERGDAGVPGQTAFGPADLDASYRHHDGVWGVSFDQTIGSLRQRASYGLSTSHQESDDLGGDPAYTPTYGDRVGAYPLSDYAYDVRDDLRRHHAGYQADWTSTTRAGTHIETALVDWDGERATLNDVGNSDVTIASRNNVGFSVQHQALWTRVAATGGLRIEHNASFGTAVVPRGTVSYYVRAGQGTIGSTRLTASAGLGIKEPTILESFSTNPFYLGNPDLKPERARTIDAGVEQRFARDRVRIEATWFDNEYRDIISTQTTSYDPYRSQYFNIGLTRAHGAELSGDVALASGFRARSGYTFTASRIVESTSAFDPVFEVGQWAFRRPRHSGFAEISWADARFSANAAATFVGRRVDSDFAGLVPEMTENPGYTRWGLRGAVRVHPRLSVTLTIDNALGAHYMEPLGYQALGRAVRFGVRTQF